MKNIILTIAFLFSLLIPCKAQVPGFIGKRFIVSGGVLFSPALNPTYSNRYSYFPLLNDLSDALFEDAELLSIYGMNWTKTLGLDYAVSRNMTVGMSLQNSRSSQIVYSGFGGWAPKNFIRYVYANSIGTNCKFYNESKGALAPIGNFQKLGLSILSIRSYDSLDNIQKKLPTNNRLLTFTYGLGKTIIFQKNFTFTYGVDVTIMLSKNIFTTYKAFDMAKYYEAGFARTRSMQLFNSYATVGFIF